MEQTPKPKKQKIISALNEESTQNWKERFEIRIIEISIYKKEFEVLNIGSYLNMTQSKFTRDLLQIN